MFDKGQKQSSMLSCDSSYFFLGGGGGGGVEEGELFMSLVNKNSAWSLVNKNSACKHTSG